MSKQSWFVTDALRLCRIGTHGLVINLAQTAWRDKSGTFPVVFAMGKGIEEQVGSMIHVRFFKPVWCWEV